MAAHCATTPIISLFLYAVFINRTDFSLPAVIGRTTPGKNTLPLNGNMGICSGISVTVKSFVSSSVNKGMISASPSPII